MTRMANGLRMLILLAAAAGMASAVHAQGTDDQRAACYGDAFRLCSAYIPDERQIEACLESQKASLSPPCAAQFDTPAPPPPPAKTRARR